MKKILIAGVALLAVTATESFKGSAKEMNHSHAQIKTAAYMHPMTDSVPTDTTKKDTTKTPPPSF